jgi:4,5-dihydroxyphthalate decarboxylase
MPSKLKLTLTCGDYEIIRPLKEGRVEADGIDLTMLCATSSRDRHWRLDRNAECDAGEFNVTGYYMARDRGHPYIALPIFLHRRFRHGFIFVNAQKGITKASDLKGGKFGCSGGMLAAACTWLRGTLGEHYGLSHKDVTWFTDRPHDIPFAKQEGFEVEIIKDGPSVEERLLSGEIDAMMCANIPESLQQGDKRIARLFPDYRQAETDYYKKTQIFPIMHTLIIKQDVVDKNPWVPENLAHAFQQSKNIALQHLRNPRVLPLAFYMNSMEEQNALLGRDPWQYGLNAINRNNADTALRYTYEQGLISKKPALDEVFHHIDDWAWNGTEGI